MIKNERQYRITKTQASQFADALRNLEEQPAKHLHPMLRRAQIDAVPQVSDADLETAIREYESLQRQPTGRH